MKFALRIACLMLCFTLTIATPVSFASNKARVKVIVAIDAGHGGKDAGAIGGKGLREADVTFAVAKKLETLLKQDPLFHPVLTRSDDSYISVSQRSEVARQHKANVLISIHADAAPNRSAKGASVWVLSNKRASSELGALLEQHEKQSELLGGAGEALASSDVNPYLSQAVLDLQFAHAQRVGYSLATFLLPELKKIGGLHKSEPEHASLGVLRSPDIPSILVEIGFISNSEEEKLLATESYQNRIASGLYRGIKNYFIKHPLPKQP